MKEIKNYKEKYECSAEAMQYAFEIQLQALRAEKKQDYDLISTSFSASLTAKDQLLAAHTETINNSAIEINILKE